MKTTYLMKPGDCYAQFSNGDRWLLWRKIDTETDRARTSKYARAELRRRRKTNGRAAMMEIVAGNGFLDVLDPRSPAELEAAERMARAEKVNQCARDLMKTSSYGLVLDMVMYLRPRVSASKAAGKSLNRAWFAGWLSRAEWEARRTEKLASDLFPNAPTPRPLLPPFPQARKRR